MKKTIGFSIFIALVSIFACNRDLDEATNEAFTPTSVEAWFNSTFRSSKEWQQNADSHNKQPDWSDGRYVKTNNLEIFEFPLIENTATISIPTDVAYASQVAQKVLEATLFRIVIVKTATNELLVRKLYYVPQYQYLMSKGYDISDAMLNKAGDDFTGLLITKNWNDQVLAYHQVKNGTIQYALVRDKSLQKKANTQRIRLDTYLSTERTNLEDSEVFELGRSNSSRQIQNQY